MAKNNLNNNYKLKISYMSFQIRAVDKTYATFRTAEPGVKALSRTWYTALLDIEPRTGSKKKYRRDNQKGILY